jgi:predicted ATPase
LRNWLIWARCFRAAVVIRRGNVDTGLRALRAELEQAGDTVLLPRYLPLLGELAMCLGQAGQADLGLQRVDAAIARCEQTGERWYLPELLRIKAELDDDHAEALLPQAQDLARQQHARAWELRIAMSLVRTRAAGARETLAAVYSAFTEGLATADLLAAGRMLDQIHHPSVIRAPT